MKIDCLDFQFFKKMIITIVFTAVLILFHQQIELSTNLSQTHEVDYLFTVWWAKYLFFVCFQYSKAVDKRLLWSQSHCVVMNQLKK